MGGLEVVDVSLQLGGPESKSSLESVTGGLGVTEHHWASLDSWNVGDEEVTTTSIVHGLDELELPGKESINEGKPFGSPPRVGNVVDSDEDGEEGVAGRPRGAGWLVCVGGQELVSLVDEGEDAGSVWSDEVGIDGCTTVGKVVCEDGRLVVLDSSNADPVRTTGRGPSGVWWISERISESWLDTTWCETSLSVGVTTRIVYMRFYACRMRWHRCRMQTYKLNQYLIPVGPGVWEDVVVVVVLELVVVVLELVVVVLELVVVVRLEVVVDKVVVVREEVVVGRDEVVVVLEVVVVVRAVVVPTWSLGTHWE